MARKKKRKPGRARCIRSYVRIAHQGHGECSFCLDEIEPGQDYEGTVWVNGVDFWVKKVHLFCEPWDDGSDDRNKSNKNKGISLCEKSEKKTHQEDFAKAA